MSFCVGRGKNVVSRKLRNIKNLFFSKFWKRIIKYRIVFFSNFLEVENVLEFMYLRGVVLDD